MEVLFPTIFLVLLGFVLLLNVITLPANWIMLGLIGLWRFAYPSPGDMGVFFFAMLVGLALFGEVIEYIAQGWGSKKYGSSTSGMWAGLLGALVGALAGLPLLFGLGAFIGALVGAWIGCYLMERYKGRNESVHNVHCTHTSWKASADHNNSVFPEAPLPDKKEDLLSSPHSIYSQIPDDHFPHYL